MARKTPCWRGGVCGGWGRTREIKKSLRTMMQWGQIFFTSLSRERKKVRGDLWIVTSTILGWGVMIFNYVTMATSVCFEEWKKWVGNRDNLVKACPTIKNHGWSDQGLDKTIFKTNSWHLLMHSYTRVWKWYQSEAITHQLQVLNDFIMYKVTVAIRRLITTIVSVSRE